MDGGGGNDTTAANSTTTTTVCRDYYDLPCYVPRTSPIFTATVDALTIVFFVIAAVGVPVLGLIIRQVQENPRGFFPHGVRRPWFRPASIEVFIASGVCAILCQGVSLFLLRQHQILLFQLLRNIGTLFIGISMPMILHAFLRPMSSHVREVDVVLRFLILIPIPHFVAAAAGIWVGVLEDRFLRDQDGTMALKVVGWVGTVSSAISSLSILIFMFWARYAFMQTLKTLGPKFLTRLRARELADGTEPVSLPPPEGRPWRTTSSSSSSIGGSSSSSRPSSPVDEPESDSGSDPSPQYFEKLSPRAYPAEPSSPRTNPSPSPLTPGHSSLYALTNTPEPPERRPSFPFPPTTTAPSRADSLDIVEWHLRAGTVKVIRSVLGLVTFYAWVSQTLLNELSVTFVGVAAVVFVSRAHQFAGAGKRLPEPK
ncbi:hypothetical protein DFJ73DRAFT_959772 [Zopfochytrium polystomum]|nr:hypothetical protein DFJ73DRAFT_959772 [Zopfochytrium polystomum]